MFPRLFPGESLLSTVGFWTLVHARRLPDGQHDFDEVAFRRRMAMQWHVPPEDVMLKVEVATSKNTAAAAQSPSLANFAAALNVTVLTVSNLFASLPPHPCL